MNLDAVKFGLAAGAVYAAAFFLYALAGALFGAVWGFAVGFFFFALLGWIYNRLLR